MLLRKSHNVNHAVGVCFRVRCADGYVCRRVAHLPLTLMLCRLQFGWRLVAAVSATLLQYSTSTILCFGVWNSIQAAVQPRGENVYSILLRGGHCAGNGCPPVIRWSTAPPLQGELSSPSPPCLPPSLPPCLSCSTVARTVWKRDKGRCHASWSLGHLTPSARPATTPPPLRVVGFRSGDTRLLQEPGSVPERLNIFLLWGGEG